MTQTKRLLILAFAALIAISMIGWRASVHNQTAPPRSTSRPTEPAGELLSKYTNDAAGISFAYPSNLMLESDRVFQGETGKKLVGVIASSEFRLSFGGITKDFSNSQGGSVLDTYGYTTHNGAYHLDYVWGDYVAEPSEFISVDDGTSQALVIKDTELAQILDASSIAAFVNLPNSLFPGLVFVLSPTRGHALSNEALDTFRNIVSSVRFVER